MTLVNGLVQVGQKNGLVQVGQKKKNPMSTAST